MPCLKTGGTQVYAYWKRGEVPADLISPDGTIPLRITVNGDCVFYADRPRQSVYY